MRIVHTSDWHLGQNFMGKSRAIEHQAFLNWLLAQVQAQQIDAIIVAGDIFDTGTPPSYARELYYNFIVALQATGCTLVVVGGNHDSVATLHETREVLACLNAHVVGGIGNTEQLHLLHRRDGTPGGILCAIPYLRPRDLITSKSGESSSDKKAALRQAISDHYATLYTRACTLRTTLANNHLPIIATGHLTTVGATSSESVREIYIGTLDAFPANAFPAADYIALGHLHKAQRVADQEHIRYSGSPIPLSFDEAKHDKQILVVDFEQGGLKEVTRVAIPSFQRLMTIQGDLTTATQQLEQMATTQASIWVEVEIVGDAYLTDLQQRLQKVIEGSAIEILRIQRLRQGSAAGHHAEFKETLAELKPQDVFARRLAEETFTDADIPLTLTQLFNELVDEIQAPEGKPNS